MSTPSADTSAYGWKVASKKRRAAASSPGAIAEASAHASISAPLARGQPERKARRLGSSGVSPQPGSASNDHGRYCARSSGGLTGGQAGQGASRSGAQAAAATRMSARASRRLWIVYLEMAVALALAGLIVWLTWPKKRK